MFVSVIIPTYKRRASVLRLLESLKTQTLPSDRFEVIVVDDGSPDETHTIQSLSFPFHFKYVRQQNQGATIARNHGVEQSRGDVLIFIDDDVTVSPSTLRQLAQRVCDHEHHLAMGTLIQRNDGGASIYADIQLAEDAHDTDADVYRPFTFCNTELLAVKRADFFALGKLQDPTGGRGWPNWDDVDFGYRAYLQGFKLLQVADAVGEHWDYSLGDWRTSCRRWQRACKSAVLLFHVHPDLQPHLPMLHDKTPVRWGEDSATLIGRKLTRRVMSTRPLLWLLEQGIRGLEQAWPTRRLLRPLYRWVAGGYMYRGYQQGLREFRPLPTGGTP